MRDIATVPGALDTSKAFVGADDYLLPVVVDRVRAIISARKMKLWRVAVAIGSHSHDMHLEFALRRGWRPAEDSLDRLRDSIATQGTKLTSA